MDSKIRTATTALALAALLAIPATAMGDNHTHQGSFPVVFTGYAVTSAQDFTLDLEAGDTVTATLAWFDDLTDLDLVFIRPGGSCTLLPEPDAPCLVDSAEGRVDCEEEPGRTTLGPSPETFTLTANEDGEHLIAVMAALAVPGEEVQYALTVDVNGAPHTLGEPRDIGYVNGGHHCRVL